MAAVPPAAARANGVQHKTGASRPNGVPRANGASAAKPRAPANRAPAARAPKAHSVAGGEVQANGVTSAYAIMANRIANRVAEMAESITFVER